MNQIALSIEQMKHLQDLGLDTRDASMYIAPQVDSTTGENFIFPIYPIENPDWDNMIKNGFVPAYTLQDLLEQLTPSHRQMVMKYEPNEWLYVAYEKLVFQLTHKEDFA